MVSHRHLTIEKPGILKVRVSAIMVECAVCRNVAIEIDLGKYCWEVWIDVVDAGDGVGVDLYRWHGCSSRVD